MAAPENIYYEDDVSFAKESILKQHKMALRSSFALSDMQLKNKYKLDYKANFVHSSKVVCFVGCVMAGSINSTFHNSARYGAKYEDLILLTDAGLNLKPPIPVFQTQSGQSTIINILNNSILLRAYAEASEFALTEVRLKSADSANLSTYEEKLINTIYEAQNESYSGLEIVFDVLYFRVGKTYILSLKSTNSEGDSYSSILSLSPSPAAVDFRYGNTIDIALASLTASTVYVNRKISNAVVADNIVFYSNASATLYVATGYYLSLTADASGNYKFFRVTGSSGQITEINSVVGSRHQDVYYYFSTISAADAISKSPSQIILYYQVLVTPPGSFENRRYYTGPFSDSSYAAQGFYVKADRTTTLYISSNGTASVLIN